MNKGVIVQIENNTAHILQNDGVFTSCALNSCWQVGDVVTVSRRPKVSLKLLLASCSAFIFLIFVSVFIMYQIPATYIEVSVNPSVQLTLNRFDRVLEATGLNAEGETLLQGISYQNLTLDEAYSRLFNRLKNNGYLNGATVQLVVANNSQKAIDGVEQILRGASEKYAPSDSVRISIKRYANDEYIALPHPLPVMEIPDQEPDEMPPQAEETPPQTEETPSQTDETPSQTEEAPFQADETPSQSEETPSPSHGMHRHGKWCNGWWDWDYS